MRAERTTSLAELRLENEALPKRRQPELGGRAKIVQLGNKGLQWDGEEDFAETRRLALTHPEWEVIGIDCAEPPSNSDEIENWNQIQGDFKAGIRLLEDGSVTRINAVYCLGYYDRNGEQLIFESDDFDASPERFPELIAYTGEVLDLCRAKLAPRGCLSVIVGRNAANIVRAALKSSSLNDCAGRERPFRSESRRLTFWIKFFNESGRPAVRFRLRNQPGELRLIRSVQARVLDSAQSDGRLSDGPQEHRAPDFDRSAIVNNQQIDRPQNPAPD